MNRLGRILAVSVALGAPAQAGSPPPASVKRVPVALLVDLSSDQTLYARNPEKAFLPASMTKAMTALVVFDLIKAGKLSEQTRVTIDPETAARWAGKGSTLSLQAGEQVLFGELLLGTTAVSANDGAVALAKASAGNAHAFIKLMNLRAQGLGMTASHFATPNGYPDGGKTRVNAHDLARLAQALTREHPALYRRYFGRPVMLWRGKELRNRDPITGTVPGADGIKTGHTFEAGFNFLGSAERNGRRLVMVLGGARTETDRANAARDLIEWGFSAWESRSLAKAGRELGRVRVQDGKRRNLGVGFPRDYAITLPRGAKAKVTSRISYHGPLRAPIQKGDTVGRLDVAVDGAPPHSFPLVALDDVAKAGPFDRIVNGLLGVFG